MVMTKTPAKSDIWTYERYMATPIEGRFEIIEGVLIRMPSPIFDHQVFSGNLQFEFRVFQNATGIGKVIAAPSDILIHRYPKPRTRQPDLYFISNARLASVGGRPATGPLEIGPELVVEIVSTTETANMIEGKTADYISVGVNEMWRVWPKTQSVEVYRLSADGAELAATYGIADTVVSLTFPDLSVPIAKIFAS